MQSNNLASNASNDVINEEVEFWHDFKMWWEGKYHESAPPRLSEALNIAEAKGLRMLSKQVELLKQK